MLTKLRINFKKYFLLTGLSTLIICFFARDLWDVLGILIVYVAACLNQFILVYFCREFFIPSIADKRQSIDKSKVAALFIFKIFILVIGISLGVLFMGNRVIFPIINYVIQMFVLVYSLKSDDQEASVFSTK